MKVDRRSDRPRLQRRSRRLAAASLEKLTAFWSSLMLTSGRYKGAPMAAHLKHGARIKPEIFDRWLALWRAATEAEMPPGTAAAMQAKAERITQNFRLALKLHPASA